MRALAAHRARRAGRCGAVQLVQPACLGHLEGPLGGFHRPRLGAVRWQLAVLDNNLRMQVHSAGRESVFPVYSRSLHIGQTSSITPGLLAEYFYKGALSSSYARGREPSLTGRSRFGEARPAGLIRRYQGA